MSSAVLAVFMTAVLMSHQSVSDPHLLTAFLVKSFGIHQNPGSGLGEDHNLWCVSQLGLYTLLSTVTLVDTARKFN